MCGYRWNQMRAQHKLLRVFYHQYQLGEDPATTPTGAQKVTVLATMVLFKMLCISLLWGQKNVDEVEWFAQKLLVGVICASLSLPASVALDQMFWRAQRIVNSASHGQFDGHTHSAPCPSRAPSLGAHC